jgi:hypothetical protein
VAVPPPDVLRPIDKVRQQSRRHYGRPRKEVERNIMRGLHYAKE